MNFLHTHGQDQLVHLHNFCHKRCQTTSFFRNQGVVARINNPQQVLLQDLIIFQNIGNFGRK